jgi:protein-arginine kinase activator protein McsA
MNDLKKMAILHAVDLIDTGQVEGVNLEEQIEILKTSLEELTAMEEYEYCINIKTLLNKLTQQHESSTEL